MNPHSLQLATRLTAAAVTGIWQGTLVAAVAAGLCTLLRSASAALRHTVLIAAFAAASLGSLVALSGATLPLAGISWVVPGAWFVSLAESRHNTTPAIAHRLLLAPWVGFAIAALWVGAALLRAAILLVAARHLRSVRNGATPLAGLAPIAVGNRTVLLCSSTLVDAPAVVGFRSPRLLLPEWMIPGLSTAEFHNIALHECEHLRRGDDWTNLLLELVLVVSPLNPALLWLRRTIRLQRELAVDDAVVRQTAEPLAYATCLTRLSEQRLYRGGHLRLALSALGRKPELVHRVHALLSRHTGWTRPRSAWAFSGALAALLLTAISMQRVPQFVQVAAPEVGHAARPDPLSTALASTAFAATRNDHAGLPGADRTAQAGVQPATHTSSLFVPTSASNRPLPLLRAELRAAVFTGAWRGDKRITSNALSSDERHSASHYAGRHANVNPRSTAASHSLTLAPHMLRTAYTAPPAGGRTRNVIFAPTINATPIVVYTRYAAVPFQDGWLFLEL